MYQAKQGLLKTGCHVQGCRVRVGDMVSGKAYCIRHAKAIRKENAR